MSSVVSWRCRHRKERAFEGITPSPGVPSTTFDLAAREPPRSLTRNDAKARDNVSKSRLWPLRAAKKLFPAFGPKLMLSF